MKIFVEAAKLEQQNRPFAMAQIIESRGSTPRHSGQMLVLDDGSVIGTIGGGMVERKVITEALLALAERKPRIFYGRMTRNGQHAVGSDCGGSMSVYIDVHGLASRLILIGAGHVNRAIAQTAAALDFEIVVLDVYADSLNAAYFPTDSKLLQVASFNQGIEQLAIKADELRVLVAHEEPREVLDKIRQSYREVTIVKSTQEALQEILADKADAFISGQAQMAYQFTFRSLPSSLVWHHVDYASTLENNFIIRANDPWMEDVNRALNELSKTIKNVVYQDGRLRRRLVIAC